MKKVIVLGFAGMLLFVACGESAEDKAKREKAIADSVENVYKIKHTEDSLKNLINQYEIEKQEAIQAQKAKEPKKLYVSEVNYDYSLKPQAGNTYDASNMCDGDNTTVWAVNLDNPNIYDCDQLYGPIFKVNCKELSHIIIRNGYGKNENSYINNSRLARIRLINFDNEKIIVEEKLKDISTPQTIEIPANAEGNNNISQIWLVIDTETNGGIYKGVKWNDLCISEIEFWGIE